MLHAHRVKRYEMSDGKALFALFSNFCVVSGVAEKTYFHISV